MRKILRFVKLFVAVSFRYTGLLWLIIRTKMKNRSVVLTYHRVLDRQHAPVTHSNPGIIVSEEIFEMHMRTLRRHFNPVSLDALRAHFEEEAALPPRSVLVTFDDGWVDNYDIAFPILKKYQIPAVIFLPVDYISADKLFWQEEITIRLRSLLSSKSVEKLDEIVRILGTSTIRSNEDLRRYVIELKSRTQAEISQVLETIREELSDIGEPSHYDRYLTWEQVEEMQSAGITFASHALSHRILNRLPPDECRTELVDSRTILQERLRRPVSAIAYPNGDHDDRVIDETRKAGYRLAFSTRGGLIEAGCDPLSIPRNNIHNDTAKTEAQFMCACVRLF